MHIYIIYTHIYICLDKYIHKTHHTVIQPCRHAFAKPSAKLLPFSFFATATATARRCASRLAG